MPGTLRLALVTLVAATSAGEAYAQRGGEVWVRPSLIQVMGTTFGVDAEYALTSHISGVVAVRKLEEGLECLGVNQFSPCKSDGTSYGVGGRVRTSASGFGFYGEAIWGFHDYWRGGLHSMASLGAGARLGSMDWGDFEVGLERRRLGAMRRSGAQLIGPTTRRVVSLRLGLGIRVGS